MALSYSVGEPAITAAVENQRRARPTLREPLDAADKDQMIAARILCRVAAFEPGAATVEQRYAVQAGVQRQVRKAVDAARGKAVGQMLLIGGEHIDRVVTGLTERLEIRRVSDRLQRISGGSSETELNELIVTPIGLPSAAHAVTTVTPVAKQPSALRKSRQ